MRRDIKRKFTGEKEESMIILKAYYLQLTAPKVKAFTLIELVVVMIISGILFSIAYFSFFIISQRFNHFSSASSSVMEISNLQTILNKDFDEAEFLQLQGDDLIVKKDSLELLYHFEEDYLLRTQLDQVDTFHIPIENKSYYFKNAIYYLNTGYIDELEFTSEYHDEKFHFHFHKDYSTEQLINF